MHKLTDILSKIIQAVGRDVTLYICYITLTTSGSLISPHLYGVEGRGLLMSSKMTYNSNIFCTTNILTDQTTKPTPMYDDD